MAHSTSKSHQSLWARRTLSLMSITKDTLTPAGLCWSWTVNTKGKTAWIIFICSCFTEQIWKMWCMKAISAEAPHMWHGFTVTSVAMRWQGQDGWRWLAAEPQHSLLQNSFWPPVNLWLVNKIGHFHRNVMKSRGHAVKPVFLTVMILMIKKTHFCGEMCPPVLWKLLWKFLHLAGGGWAGACGTFCDISCLILVHFMC